MSKARDLGNLLDTDGDVVSSSLDNVPTPSKTSIEALGIDVPAANLTGSIANARIPAGAVTQHVTATDLTPVHQSIATLGLHMGVADNKAAYNLPNAFIDTFEDDTGITTETTVDRNTTGEYVSSTTQSTGSQTQVAQGTGTGIGDFDTRVSAAFDGTTNQAASSGAVKSSATNEAWLGKDWGSGVTKTINGFKAWSSNNDGMNGSGSNSSGASINLYGSNTNNTATAVNLGGLTSLDFTQNNHVADYTKLTGLTTSTAYRYHWLKFTTVNNTNTFHCAEVQFFEDPIPIVGIFIVLVISFATLGVIHSKTIENAPAFSNDLASFNNFFFKLYESTSFLSNL